jgi:ATP-dependent exoDNAse (exonuclease V) alpha subunit
MTVFTDDRRHVSFDPKDYDCIDHGYAAAIHKVSGMTVDRTNVLATPGMDAHGSYVALSRHHGRKDLNYGRADFDDSAALPQSRSGVSGIGPAAPLVYDDAIDRPYCQQPFIAASLRIVSRP